MNWEKDEKKEKMKISGEGEFEKINGDYHRKKKKKLLLTVIK